ncbi:DNA-directed DNA/RNA polymerase mu [Termitomyces sp. T112]|nr:DNA-directed DNA/RNA polymerase mu [Termitomyces sp. T112]
MIKVYILQAKLDATAVAELYTLIESCKDVPDGLRLQLCGNPSDADVILSNVHMRKRLERHLDWDIAKQKAIVTPDWLHDSVAQQRPLNCADYAALGELREETDKNCPDCDLPKCICSSESSKESLLDNGTMNLITSPHVSYNYAARYSCQRASPLVCPNQRLANELSVLRIHRDLEGKTVNALSYERAIAVIKAYPRVITQADLDTEVVHLPYLGEKIRSKINEFIRFGRIEECNTIRSSARFLSLKAFASIHGVGSTTARHLYSIGLRTVEDMEQYYDVPIADDGVPLLPNNEPKYTPNGKRIPTNDTIPDLDIKAALVLRHEFAISISRSEVEEMHNLIMAELNDLKPGCASTIVGGYRRGKPESNDVDIVITHADLRGGGEKITGLRKRFVERLYNRGLVSHVARGAGFIAQDSFRWHSLENALTVFRLPAQVDARHLHRRLDLIIAAPEAYWSAVVGWTGSKMFERDLRLWAKTEKGLKFDSSAVTRRHDSKRFFPQSENDVFSLLGLQWIDPTLRNADI